MQLIPAQPLVSLAQQPLPPRLFLVPPLVPLRRQPQVSLAPPGQLKQGLALAEDYLIPPHRPLRHCSVQPVSERVPQLLDSEVLAGRPVVLEGLARIPVPPICLGIHLELNLPQQLVLK